MKNQRWIIVIENSVHFVDESSLKSVQHMILRTSLETYEYLEIIKGDNILNNDRGQAPSAVYTLY